MPNWAITDARQGAQTCLDQYQQEQMYRQGNLDNIPQGNPADKRPYNEEQMMDFPYLLGSRR